MRWTGEVVSGQGVCSEELPFDEYLPGSLNLDPVNGHPPLLSLFNGDRPNVSRGKVTETWMPVQLYATIVHPTKPLPVLVGLGNGDITELRARCHLRTLYGLTDGDQLTIDLHL